MLFRGAWKLTNSVQSDLHSSTRTSSLFDFLQRAGSELSATSKPTDLKSLVRVLSAVGTFRYPAFKPAIKRMVHRSDMPEWDSVLVGEASQCAQPKALEYLKVLTQANISQELLETLIQKVKISSPQDIRDYIQAIQSLPTDQLSSSIRNATTFVVKNAIIARMRLSTYLQIWHMINHHWRCGHKHVIPTKLRSDLIQATWSSVPNLDLTKEADFVDCVTWLAMADQPSLLPNKDELAAVLDKLEIQARRSITKPLSPSSMLSLISHIIAENRGDPLREPLDSISQILLKQFTAIRKPQHQDHLTTYIDLASAIERFLSRGTGSAVSEIVETVLPITVEVLERNLSQIPSRSLPIALRLISRVGGNTEDEIARRGHELEGVELVRLVNSAPVSRDLILSLFKTTLNDVNLLTDLLVDLSLSEKLEFLSTLVRAGIYHHDDLTILTEGLIEAIKSDVSKMAEINQTALSLDTLIKICTCGDPELIESLTSGSISPKQLLNEFLASERPELNVNHAIELLDSNACTARTELLDFVFASRNSLSATQCIRLLSVLDSSESAFQETIKLVVPKIAHIDDINQVMMHIKSGIPITGSKFSPMTQLKIALQDRIAALVGQMDLPSIATCLCNMVRMDLYSVPCVSNLMSRLGQVGVTGSHGLGILQSLVALRVFDKQVFDLITRDFLNNRNIDSELVADLAFACTQIGYRHKGLMDACEAAVRRENGLDVSISLLHSLAANQIYSPLFQEKLRHVMEECGRDISTVPESDWVKLYEINLALLVDSPPRIKSKYMTDRAFKSFIEDNCSYSWYAKQERARSGFIHSTTRSELQAAIESLGWTMRVPEIGKEVYHVDLLSSGPESENRVAIILVPKSDELRQSSSSVPIVIGDSMTKIRHLQMFGYTVVPVWESEWVSTIGKDNQKQLLLKYSNQVVYATGVSAK